MTPALAWLVLLAGGLFEIVFTTCLRNVEGFRNVPWSIGFFISVVLSLVLLELAARTIPMGTAYAVWTGIGALGTVVIGMIWFGEAASTVRMLLILLLIASIVGLRITGS